jgi:hypothetical protein
MRADVDHARSESQRFDWTVNLIGENLAKSRRHLVRIVNDLTQRRQIEPRWPDAESAQR